MVKYKTLRDTRNKSGYRALDVAEALGLGEASLMLKEQGKVKITLGEAFVLSTLFGVSIETLFPEEVETDENNTRS